MLRWALVVALALVSTPVLADRERPVEVQADLGLAVIAAAVEVPVAHRHTVQIEAGVFGTYFLPWFGAGDNVAGYGVGIRPTWFFRHHVYLAPFLRIDHVSGDRDGLSGNGNGFSLGAFVGKELRASRRVDVRIGAGLQYLRYIVRTAAGDVEANTPFVALDLVVGYRLGR